MLFLRRDINKNTRNGDIYISSKYISNASKSGGNSSGNNAVSSGNYLPATANTTDSGDTYYLSNTNVTFDGDNWVWQNTDDTNTITTIAELTKDGLKVYGDIVATGEVSAFDKGESGSTDVDLSNYYTKEEVNNLIDNIEIGDIDLSGYYTSTEVDSLLSNKSNVNHTHSNYSLTSHTHNYLPLSGGTMSGNLTMSNSKVLNWLDSNGTERSVISLSGLNELSIAYGTQVAGYKTYIGGSELILSYGTSRATGAVLDSNGVFNFNNNVTIGANTTDYRNISIGKTDGYNASFQNSAYLSSSREASISWRSGTTTIGAIGVGDYPFYNNGTTNYTLLHSGNYSSYSPSLSVFNSHSGNTTIHITSSERTNWNNTYNKLNDYFYVDDNGDLHTSYSFVSDGEISAFDKGESGSTDIDLSDYYTKEEVNNLIDNIEIGDIDLSSYYTSSEIDSLLSNKSSINHSHSNYSLTSHTHSNYLTRGSWLPQNDCDFDDYYKSGLYAHAVGNGSGYTNNPALYGLMMVFGDNQAYAAQLHVDTGNIVKVRTRYYRTNSEGVAETCWNDWTRLSKYGHTHNALTFAGGSFTAKTYDCGSKVTVNVPTHTSHITNNSGFITTAATVANSYKLYNDSSTWKALTVSTHSATGGKGEGIDRGWYSPYGAYVSGTTDYGQILRFDYSEKYYTDFFVDANDTKLAYRRVINGVNNGWRYILDSNNYTNYALSNSNDDYYGIQFNSTLEDDAVRLMLSNNGNYRAGFGYSANSLYISNYGSGKSLTFSDKLYFNNNIVLDASNYSTYAATKTNFNTHSGNTTIHITSIERTNWNSAYNKLNDYLYIDSNGNLHTKYSFVSDGEVSAFNEGESETIDLSNYYTKAEVNNLIDNIEIGDIDLSSYYNKTQVDSLLSNKSSINHTHSNYSLTSHTHSNYSLTGHTHAISGITNLQTTLNTINSSISNIEDQMSTKGHTHTISNIVNLQTTLNGKSNTGHTHSYLPLSGGSMSTTSLVTNLNADRVDGYHATSLFRNFGGTNVDFNFDDANGNNGIYYLHSDYTQSNKPFTYGSLLNLSSGVGSWQLAVDTSNTLWFRSVWWQGNGYEWPDWVALSKVGHSHSTLTFSAGAFSANTYNGSAAKTVKVPTHTSHITNNSGYITSGATVAAANKVTNTLTFTTGTTSTGTFNGSSAVTIKIPSNTTHLTNGSGFITSGATVAAANKVTSTLTLSAGTFSANTFNGSAAKTVYVPTHTSHITNNSGFITSGATVAAANKVTSTLTFTGYQSKTYNGSAAVSVAIPNNTNQLTNGSGYITTAATVAAANKVTSTLTLSAGTFSANTFNGSAAKTVYVPTHTSHLTNNSGFITTAATVTNSDKLDGYHGSSANTANNYVLRGSSKQILVGAITASGDIYSSGEVTAASDRRLKSNIKPLEVRGELHPVTFEKDGKESIGFIAQEVQEVYPELVRVDEESEEKYLSLNYAQLTAVLYAEIQALKTKITDLEKQIQ